jgi:hypothetical protein
LRIHTSTDPAAGSGVPHALKFVFANDWQEQWMSFNNTVQPVAISSSPMGTLTGPSPDTWYASQLTTSTVQAHAGGLLSMAMDAPAGDVLIFYSRESGLATAPQLVLTLQ